MSVGKYGWAVKYEPASLSFVRRDWGDCGASGARSSFTVQKRRYKAASVEWLAFSLRHFAGYHRTYPAAWTCGLYAG